MARRPALGGERIVWLALAALGLGLGGRASAAEPSCRLEALRGCAPGPLLAEYFSGAEAWALDVQLEAPEGASLAVVAPPAFAQLASRANYSAEWPCGDTFRECSRPGVLRAGGAFYVVLSSNGTVSGRVGVAAVHGWALFAACAASVSAAVLCLAGCLALRRWFRRAAASRPRPGLGRPLLGEVELGPVRPPPGAAPK